MISATLAPSSQLRVLQPPTDAYADHRRVAGPIVSCFRRVLGIEAAHTNILQSIDITR
jgi:hypothetical protein